MLRITRACNPNKNLSSFFWVLFSWGSYFVGVARSAYRKFYPSDLDPFHRGDVTREPPSFLHSVKPSKFLKDKWAKTS